MDALGTTCKNTLSSDVMLPPLAKTVKLFPQNPRSTCAFELQIGKHLRFFLPCPRLFLKYWVRNLLTKVSSTYSFSLAIEPRVVPSCIIKISMGLVTRPLYTARMLCLFKSFSASSTRCCVDNFWQHELNDCCSGGVAERKVFIVLFSVIVSSGTLSNLPYYSL